MARRLRPAVAVASLALGATGCASHLIFGETSHVGLKAEFAAESATPAEVSLGYRRSVIAWAPRMENPGEVTLQRPSPDDGGGASPPGPGNAPGNPSGETIEVDEGELVSLYTRFRANVGFADPVCFEHLLATGSAAIDLAADQAALRAFVASAALHGSQDGQGTATSCRRSSDSDSDDEGDTR